MLYKLLLAFQHFILTPFFCPLGRGSLLTPACAVAEPGTDRWGLETWRVCFVPCLHSHPASSIRTACPTSLPLYHKALMRQADKPLLQTLRKRKLKSPSFQAASPSLEFRPCNVILLNPQVKQHVPMSFTWTSLVRRSSSGSWGDTAFLLQVQDLRSEMASVSSSAGQIT